LTNHLTNSPFLLGFQAAFVKGLFILYLAKALWGIGDHKKHRSDFFIIIDCMDKKDDNRETQNIN
jgi:hypothetical protein